MRRTLIIQLLGLSIVIGAVSFVVAFWIDWLPVAAAKEAERIHDTYVLTSIICLVIFAIVAAVSVYAFVKFRVPEDDEEDGKPFHGHTKLEIVWTAIPTALVTVIAVFTAVALVKNEETSAASPPRVMEVKAWQFAWAFRYPELGDVEIGELRVPLGEQTEFQLESPDVIHSFWVPEWSVKMDVVPGTIQRLLVTPTKLGTYPIICTELCGLGHGTMRNRVIVMTREDYDAWIAEMKQQLEGPAPAETAPPAEPEQPVETQPPAEPEPAETVAPAVDPAAVAAGKDAFTAAGCSACHALADAGATGNIGPDLDAVLAGANAAFIRESIVDPAASIAEGYQAGIMPPDFESTLTPEQLDGLVEYLLSVASG